MADPAPCKHERAVVLDKWDSYDKEFWCPECERLVPPAELPDEVRRYWSDKREAWGGR